jgi:hypothetical protein
VKSSNPHVLLTLQIRALRLPKPEHEFRFHPTRRWRWDLCFTHPHMLAVEVHGGVYKNGRHTRGKGFTEDRRKMLAGVELGWRVIEVTTEMVESGEAVRAIQRLLSSNP